MDSWPYYVWYYLWYLLRALVDFLIRVGPLNSPFFNFGIGSTKVNLLRNAWNIPIQRESVSWIITREHASVN